MEFFFKIEIHVLDPYWLVGEGVNMCIHPGVGPENYP